MVLTYSPDSGGAGGTSNYAGETGSNDLGYNPDTGTMGNKITAGAQATQPTYGYIDNSGTIVQSKTPVNVDANGNVYDQSTGMVLSGPQTGNTINLSQYQNPTSGSGTTNTATGGTTTAGTAFSLPTDPTTLLIIVGVIGAMIVLVYLLL